MINLVRADIYRLFKTKSLYICTLASVAFIIFSLFTYQLMYNFLDSALSEQDTTQSQSNTLNEEMQDEDTENIQIDETLQNTDTEDVQKDNVSDGKILPELTGIYMLEDSFTNIPIFLGIFLAMFITAEFSNGTIKNIVSRGFSRSQIYLSKFIAAIITNLFLIVITSASALIAGTIMWKFGTTYDNFILDVLRMFFLEVLVNIAVSSIFVMVAFLVRRNGPAVSINLGIWALSSVVLNLINLLFEKVFKTDFKITKYWALDCVSELHHLSLEQSVINRGILVSLGTIIVTGAIGMYTFSKRDIN